MFSLPRFLQCTLTDLDAAKPLRWPGQNGRQPPSFLFYFGLCLLLLQLLLYLLLVVTMRIADAMCHTCFMLQALVEESGVEVDSMAREWTSPSPSRSPSALPAPFPSLASLARAWWESFSAPCVCTTIFGLQLTLGAVAVVAVVVLLLLLL